MPAVLVGAAFSTLSQRAADALFVALGAALLAWALTSRTLRNPQLLALASFPMWVAAQTVQWSPLYTAATVLPWLGGLYACKPSVALAYLAAYASRLAVASAGLFAAATILVWPWWPGEWIARLPAATHMSAPVTRWGGPVLLLALLKWRRPEARLLAGLACIPQTPVVYEALPLFLIVRTLEEGLILCLSTLLMVPVARALQPLDYLEWMRVNGQWMIWFVYVPALLILLRRPNAAPDDDPVRVLEIWLRDRLSARRRQDGGNPRS